MSKRVYVGLAALVALGLLVTLPFGVMKQGPEPLQLILEAVSSIDAKLDTIIALLSPVVPGGVGFNAPVVLGVTCNPMVPGVGEMAVMEITVYDEDVAVYGMSQAIDLNTKFYTVPPGSTATLVPSFGYTPAFVPDIPGEYGLRVTVVDDTGLSSFYEFKIIVPESPP
ncbi:hypothetical protein JXL21_08010 [Candidatus Bathyarchaeota archaeon]|nr:hypothetical protein [Candidatus Bathyarchaeota archaeon]